MLLFTLANAVTGTGAQTTQNLFSNGDMDRERDKITVEFIVTAGSARSVQVEGSLDGTNWALLGTAVTATGTTIQEVPRVPMIRANVTSNTGSTITVLAAI